MNDFATPNHEDIERMRVWMRYNAFVRATTPRKFMLIDTFIAARVAATGEPLTVTQQKRLRDVRSSCASIEMSGGTLSEDAHLTSARYVIGEITLEQLTEHLRTTRHETTDDFHDQDKEQKPDP
jgi:hypothetical protein